jgi:hypothetical protein
MKLFDLLFPIIKTFEDIQRTDLDEISENNYYLAKELEGKPPMSAQEIKEYVKNKNAGGACEIG